MSPFDLELANQIVNGGAVLGLIVLVIYVIRQSEKREQIMRESFAAREKQFVDALNSSSTQLATTLAKTLADNTSALTTLTTMIEQKLEQMEEHIAKKPKQAR